MVFTLRETTLEMTRQITASYYRNPHIALVTVGTGGGKTYGAIHTLASYYPDALLLVFTTTKVRSSKQWEQSVADYNSVMSTQLLVHVANYEGILTKKIQERLDYLLESMQTTNRKVFLVLDEAHKIKLSSNSALSTRAQLIIHYAKNPSVVSTLALSATPFSNSYLDLVPYFIIAHYYKDQRDFIKQHIRLFDKYFKPVVKDRAGRVRRDYFKHPEIIDQHYANISVYIDTDYLKPSVTTYHCRFKLTPIEQSNYNQLKKDFEKGLYEYPVQVRSAQEQLLASSLSGQKNRLLLYLLKQREAGFFDEKQTPILIFYQYTVVYHELKALLEATYPDYELRFIRGGITLSQAKMSEPENPNTIYLIQYESGGEGLDWQWSNLAIFYEAPVKNEKFKQSLGRNVRNKEIMSHVFHFYFEYVNTLDARRWLVNRYKQDFADDIADRLF